MILSYDATFPLGFAAMWADTISSVESKIISVVGSGSLPNIFLPSRS